MSDYDRIASAIEFIEARADSRPALDEIAAHVHLSPYHFQRLFGRWAGVSPKRFLQALTVERAKILIDSHNPTALALSDTLGLSSSSRLHDHFVSLEAVTPDEYRARGRGIEIAYGLADSPFGPVFVGQTARGVCRMGFLDGDFDEAVRALADLWPGAALSRDDPAVQATAARIFGIETSRPAPLSAVVRGTNFQIAVWRALLDIPSGRMTSYSALARCVGNRGAARAVGTAVGANPVAFLIPCHRVIRESGALGGYRWGTTRKRAILAWESARQEA